MPVYHLNSSDLNPIITALLAMTGPPSSGGMERLIVPCTKAVFRPSGPFAQVYDRYQCAVCHRFNGYGGDLAPDLSYEGSRAPRPWLISFLKNPQTVRPTLTFRMPQFNMTDQEASIAADYLGMVFQSPLATPAGADRKESAPQLASMGKQLYEVKYQCQSCHTIGSAGGYVGPNLSNAGNWLTPAWIEAWLKNPQALVPGTIEPRRAFTEDEVKALTAYLLTLRQAGPARAGAAQGGGR